MLGKKETKRDASKDLGKPFDLTVNKGSSTDAYRLYVEKGQQIYERPPGSGHFYSQNGHYLTEADFEAIDQLNDKEAKPKTLKERAMETNKHEQEQKDQAPKKPEAGKDHFDRQGAQQELDEQGNKASQGAPAGKDPGKPSMGA